MFDNLNKIIEEVNALPTEDQGNIIQMVQQYLESTRTLKGIVDKEADYHDILAEAAFFTGQLLGPCTRGLLVDSFNGLFVTDPQDYGVGWRLRKEGAFEPEQLEFLKTLIDAQSNVLVVGAHIGTMAIPLSKVCAYTAAVEANPNTFQLLELNIKLNNLHNCEAFNLAANNVEETITFLASRSNSGGSKRKPVADQHIYAYDQPEVMSVQGHPLDEVFNNKVFDLIIMDIEGSEYFALKGMQQLLSGCRTLVIEFLPHHLKNVSGVTVDEFLSAVPSYGSLIIPSLNKQVTTNEFSSVLNYMYEHDLEDNGIVFMKS